MATGKNDNPLAAGKPFINNFLPNSGDMLHLNTATSPPPHNSPDFSSEGIIQAAVLGLTDPAYNGSSALQWILNMDCFLNRRRLEDDSEAYTPLSEAYTPLSEAYTFVSDAHSPLSEAYTFVSDAHSPLSDAHTFVSDAHSPLSEAHTFVSEAYSPLSEAHTFVSEGYSRLE